ncbi:MAG: hypothetical protein Q7R48_00445 [bacterium]|nr:hypothetical protein [bacterium]
MLQRRRQVRLGLLALVLISLVLACGSSTSQIVGTWESRGTFIGWGERIEFSSDGSFTSYDVGGVDIKGDYSFPESGVIKFEAGRFGVAKFNFSIKGDRLTFQDPPQGPVEYRRIKR